MLQIGVRSAEGTRAHLLTPFCTRHPLSIDSSPRQRDFGIAPISAAGGAVTVKDEVKVTFEIAPAS